MLAGLIMSGKNHHPYLVPSSIRFKPCRGRNFGTPQSIFSRPTLILGGSAYSDGPEATPEEDADATQDLLSCYFDDKIRGRWKATYTRFINAVYGDDTNGSEREAYFDSIIFYNYLQEYAGSRPGDAPKFDYAADQHFSAFLEVLNEHKPDVIIAWGNLVWNALPDDWGFGSANKEPQFQVLGRTFVKYQTYPYAGRDILLVGVKHPSTSFSRDFHHELFLRLNLLCANATA